MLIELITGKPPYHIPEGVGRVHRMSDAPPKIKPVMRPILLPVEKKQQEQIVKKISAKTKTRKEKSTNKKSTPESRARAEAKRAEVAKRRNGIVDFIRERESAQFWRILLYAREIYGCSYEMVRRALEIFTRNGVLIYEKHGVGKGVYRAARTNGE